MFKISDSPSFPGVPAGKNVSFAGRTFQILPDFGNGCEVVVGRRRRRRPPQHRRPVPHHPGGSRHAPQALREGDGAWLTNVGG